MDCIRIGKPDGDGVMVGAGATVAAAPLLSLQQFARMSSSEPFHLDAANTADSTVGRLGRCQSVDERLDFNAGRVRSGMRLRRHDRSPLVIGGPHGTSCTSGDAEHVSTPRIDVEAPEMIMSLAVDDVQVTSSRKPMYTYGASRGRPARRSRGICSSRRDSELRADFPGLAAGGLDLRRP